MKKKKFSMVEVMVVVAVMATLITMLFTSVNSSNELAKSANCMSNISQIRTYVELYRKDNAKLPYSEIWLTDFSFTAPYLSGTADLAAFTCPGSEDEQMTSMDQLSSGSSYYYVPSVNDLVANLGDGSNLGIDFLDIPQIQNLDQLVIYDKSPDHHNGKVNAAWLYSDDTNKTNMEGKITVLSDVTSLPSVDGSGNLVISDPETYGSLNINPNNSDGNIFTLTDLNGDVIEVRDDSPGTGSATTVTIQVKSQGRTLQIGDETIELDTNTSYDIVAIGDDETSDEDAYFNYELTQDGNGNGQWWLDLFHGIGSIEVINNKDGSSKTIQNGNGNGRVRY